MKRKRFLSLLVVLTFATLADAKVSVNFDETVDFAEYKTYAWHKGTPAADTLIQSHIENAINDQLGTRGLSKTADQPDMYVVVHVTTKENKQVIDSWLGYDSKSGHWGRHKQMTTVEVGTLMVDLLDGKSKKLVWRGVATKTLEPRPKNPKKTIDKIVARMFRRFPPRK
ncbi:MAG: DUF4136 domain-containing protein [Acidiferrobacterales bacterium]